MNLTTQRGHLAALVLAVTALVAGTSVFAQSMMDETKMATLICRPARSGETANAAMTKTSTQLVCKPFAVRMHMSDGSMKTIGNTSVKAQPGPDLSRALTPQQSTDAYNKWVTQTFSIDHSP